VWIESWSVERSRGSKCLHLLLCLVFVWDSSSRTWSTKRPTAANFLERRFQSVSSIRQTTFFVDMGGVIKEDVLAHPDLRSFLSLLNLNPTVRDTWLRPVKLTLYFPKIPMTSTRSSR